MKKNKLTWYEFGGPGDHYSFRAVNDKAALAACILISPQGMMIFYEPEDMSVPSPAHITLSGNAEEMLKEIYPVGLSEFIDENTKNLLNAFSDCMIGTVQDRKELEQNLEFVIPEKKGEFIEQWQDNKRTSMMNLQPYIDELVELFQEKLKKAS